jgi:site-specific DNA-cytosine methylase
MPLRADAAMALNVLEWHCGIGGAAAAMGESAHVIAAVDINRDALAVYAANFPGHRPVCKNIESLSSAEVASWGVADLWWMSPPCQPHTVLGKKRDMDDPRSASFKRMLSLIDEFRPPHLAMENVPGFAASLSRQMLLDTLSAAGYAFAEEVVCPTRFGWPNRRERYYLAATRASEGLAEPGADLIRRMTLREAVSDAWDEAECLRLDDTFRSRYAGAIHVADRFEEDERTNCFTSAYGRSPTRCGSYLAVTESGAVRRFAPREVLTLLDFPESYQLPQEMPPRKLWPLVGNSLTLGATRRTLSRLRAVREVVRRPDQRD